jgi:guanine deaminase
MAVKIYKADILFTPSAAAFEAKCGGYVVVDDDGIIQGVYDRLPEEWAGHEVIDYGDRLLIPAMNDMHVHAPQYANMGVAMDLELLPWLETYVFPEEMRFADEDYARRMYRRFVAELCRQGTMRASVFATTHLPATNYLAACFAEAGMGALIGLVGMDRHSPDGLQNTAASWSKDMDELVGEMATYAQVKPIVTPRFVPSCSSAMLQAMGRMAQERGMAVQSHLSENKKEIAWVKELEPEARTYGEAYWRYGLFGQTPTLMAHCCYTDGEELALMRDQGVTVVHCPTSNCNLASGIAPVRRFLQEGVHVVLGSDIAGGHSMSMLRVMQYAVQMSKLECARSDGRLPFLSLSEVFYMATKAGGAFFGKVGSFEKGYAFDALLVDDRSLRCGNEGSEGDLKQRLERLVYMGDDRHIEKRFCQGKLIEIKD